MLAIVVLTLLFSPRVYSQYVYISFKSDSIVSKKKCELYFSHLKNGVLKYDIYLPTNGFRSFRCPLDTSFEIILDCWKDRKVLDKIFPKCEDSIIINLDSRKFSYLNRKE